MDARWQLVLLVFALVLFVLAALNVQKDNPRINLGWAGMACVAAFWLFG